MRYILQMRIKDTATLQEMNISDHNSVGKICNYYLVCMYILILYMACI